jgi:hypothetical protein
MENHQRNEIAQRYSSKMFLFYILGIGTNWVFASVLLQQVPYLENHAPEGHAIAAYMNVANSMNIIFCIAYWIYTTYIGPIPHNVAVPFILFLSCFVGFLSIAIYDITSGNVSICLYICCLLAGAVGSLSSVAMNPFMTNYERDCISFARAGGSGTILLIALLSIAQDPGSDNIRFSPRVFFAIFAIILITPMVAYKVIIDGGVGLKAVEKFEEQSKDDSLELVQNPITNESQSIMKSSALSDTDDSFITESRLLVSTPFDFIGHSIGKFVVQNILKRWLSEEQVPWTEKLVPYIMTVGD